MSRPSRPAGRPRTFDTPEDLWGSFIAYRLWAQKKGRILNIGGFTTFCQVYHDILNEYGSRAGFSETVKAIKHAIYSDKQDALIHGEGSTPGLIFDLKNNHEWTDKTLNEVRGSLGMSIEDRCKLARQRIQERKS